mmetsp:Transcript_60885/g.176091  ORF Transcript_60885/g.176091 Transcript_60885/m.176091 type:complete len:81 (+) Transcript_60885:101-343(+)
MKVSHGLSNVRPIWNHFLVRERLHMKVELFYPSVLKATVEDWCHVLATQPCYKMAFFFSINHGHSIIGMNSNQYSVCNHK